MKRLPRRIMIRTNKQKCFLVVLLICVGLYGVYYFVTPGRIVENPEQVQNVTEVYRSKSTVSSVQQKPTKESPENVQPKHEKVSHETAPHEVAIESSTAALAVPDELETVKVPSGNKNGSFTVSKKFWELASQNTKQIFSTLPNKFIKSFKNPCFWQQFQGQITSDPYKNSPYAPEIGVQIKYDPWGHTAYYKRARERFESHLRKDETEKRPKYSRLRCLPYFYLISTPKSGTTTLWNQLSKNSDVTMRIGIKENAWWNFMRNGINGDHHWVYHLVNPPPRYIPNDDQLQSVDQFMDLFDNEAMDFLDMAKSGTKNFVEQVTALAPINLLTAPMDFWDILYPELVDSGFDAPPHILHPAYIISKVQPEAKFVALLRNPTDRLYSDWEFFWKKNDKHAFHKLVVHAVNEYKECVSKFNERKCLYDWKLIARSLRLNRGLYAPFLEDLFQIFPRKNVLVLPFEYYTTEQLDATNQILEFLNLTKVEDEKQILKKAYYNRWFIAEEDRIMLNQTRDILEDFYNPYNVRLAKLLDDDRFLFGFKP